MSAEKFLNEAELLGFENLGYLELVVVVLNYNQRNFLSDSINSVLQQEWCSDWRILLHDDASSDGSADLIRSYLDRYPGKILAVLQKNNKFQKGFNIPHELQKIVPSTYISRLDGDDIFISGDKLIRQVGHLKADPSIGLAYHDYLIVNEDGAHVALINFGNHNLKSWFRLLLGNFIPTSSAVYRSDMSLDVPEELGRSRIQDWPLWAIIESRGKIAHIQGIFSGYRIHNNNSFANKSNSEFIEDTIKVHKLLSHSLKGYRRCAWRGMSYVYIVSSRMNSVTFGVSLRFLTKLRSVLLGYQESSY
jgi:glycosyltransferase involved in cell wall biosynthesis